MGKGEDRRRLSLRIGIHRVGLDAEVRLEQPLDHIDRLPDAWWDEVLEDCDVIVRHVPIGHGTHLAVAEVIPGQEVVVIEVELGAIRCHRLTVTPYLGQV